MYPYGTFRFWRTGTNKTQEKKPLGKLTYKKNQFSHDEGALRDPKGPYATNNNNNKSACQSLSDAD